MEKCAFNKPLKNSIIILITLSLLFVICGTVDAEESTITVTVLDSKTGNPIANATVTVTQTETESIVAKNQTDSTGYFEVSGLSPGNYEVEIMAGGYFIETKIVEIGEVGHFGNGDTYDITVHLDQITLGREKPSESDDAVSPFLYQTVLIIIIAFIISIVMYSKIKRENLLKNAVRKRIFDYIKENPGMHYRAILSGLDLPMGVLSYHLNRLEKAQYIKSRQDGMYRRFFIKGPKTEVRFFLSDIQGSILGIIKENQGISQSKIAEKISVSRKVVNYHVNILNQAGLIFMESNGRETACYAIESKTGQMG